MEKPETENLQPTAENSLCLLPGHLFFIEGFKLPDGLSAEEIPSFAELSLEALAPFPIEHLNWGYLCDFEKQRLLYFAAHQDRLKQAGFKDLESYTRVLPDFLAFHAINPKAGRHIFQSPISCAEVVYDEPPGIPELIITQPSIKPEDQAKFELLSAKTDEEQNVYFEIRTPHQDIAQSAPLDPETLWAADLRPMAFKNSERRSRKLSTYFLEGFKYAACFAALLLVTEALLLTCNLWLNNRESKIESQSAAVAQIQEKQALSVKLQRVFENQLRPVAMLETLNIIRPYQSIHFTETSTEENNRVTLEGEANTVNALNDYIEKLKASGQFEILTPPKTFTRSGKTSFTLQLSYLHREAQTPAIKKPDKAQPESPS